MSKLRLTVFAVLVLFLPAGSLRAGGLKHEDGIWELRTRHYHVRSDVSPAFTETLAQHMEAIFKEYRKRLRGFGGSIKERFEVMVTSSEERYLSETGIRVRGSKGIFSASRRLLAAWVGDTPHDRVFRVLYHEGFHQFVHHCIGKCPIWLNEGMAEFFSEATWNGKRFDVGEVPPHRLAILRRAIEEDRTIRMGELVTMSHEAWLRNLEEDAERTTIQYNQAWGLVHFLVYADDGKYRNAFVRYVRLVDRDPDSERAFEHCFGRNFDAMKKAWVEYIRSLEPSPKYVCRNRLRALATLWSAAGDRREELKTLSDLRHELLERPGASWFFSSSDGTKYSSEDRQAAAEMFRCPLDKNKHAKVSYVMRRRSGEKYPVFMCDHHPAITLTARLVDDGDGKPQVVVTEKVASTRRKREIPKPSEAEAGRR